MTGTKETQAMRHWNVTGKSLCFGKIPGYPKSETRRWYRFLNFCTNSWTKVVS